jgi:hypothetical protein
VFPLSLTRHERWVALILLALAGAWLLPAMQQPAEYHDFADRRTFLGIANAGDVLSNAAFALVGLYGFLQLQRARRSLAPAMRASLRVFFAGLVLTALGSAYYHLEPTNATLVLDRLPMTIAFAGVFGAVVAERVSTRAGFAALAVMLAVGLASVVYWKYTDNLTPYAAVQFGGMAGVVILLVATPRGAEALPWWGLIAWYALSKLLETGDTVIWHASSAAVAGHLLKHLAAAMAGLAIAHALRRPAPAASPDLAVDGAQAAAGRESR